MRHFLPCERRQSGLSELKSPMASKKDPSKQYMRSTSTSKQSNSRPPLSKELTKYTRKIKANYRERERKKSVEDFLVQKASTRAMSGKKNSSKRHEHKNGKITNDDNGWRRKRKCNANERKSLPSSEKSGLFVLFRWLPETECCSIVARSIPFSLEISLCYSELILIAPL